MGKIGRRALPGSSPARRPILAAAREVALAQVAPGRRLRLGRRPFQTPYGDKGVACYAPTGRLRRAFTAPGGVKAPADGAEDRQDAQRARRKNSKKVTEKSPRDLTLANPGLYFHSVFRRSGPLRGTRRGHIRRVPRMARKQGEGLSPSQTCIWTSDGDTTTRRPRGRAGCDIMFTRLPVRTNGHGNVR